MRALRILPPVLFLCLASGCVSQGEHDKAMADWANRLKAAQTAAAQADAASKRKLAAINQRITELQAQIKQRDDNLIASKKTADGLQKKLDDSTALNEQLKKELTKLGKNVDKLLSEKGKLGSALTDTKKRLEELRRAQEAAQKRAALFRKLALKFKKMVDAGNLKIVVRDGRMVLQLRNDVLFDSGSIRIKQEGKDALTDVAGVLATIKDRKLQVGGHTDNVPISTNRFPSNWELSATRAVVVVRYLVKEGVAAKQLSAAGYGEMDPVAPNESKEEKARNRRIEIALQPNINELISIPDLK